MSHRRAIGAVLASFVVLVGTGCDSGSDSASSPGNPATALPPPTKGRTTGETTITSGNRTPAPRDTSPTPGGSTTSTQGGATTSTPSRTTGTTLAARRYALGSTRRCLERAGMRVGKVTDSDSRLQALGDLAQSTSLEVRRGEKVVGLAIADVELLANLLAVPNDPYRIETQGNALLMFKPAARDLSRRVRDCLRE